MLSNNSWKAGGAGRACAIKVFRSATVLWRGTVSWTAAPDGKVTTTGKVSDDAIPGGNATQVRRQGTAGRARVSEPAEHNVELDVSAGWRAEWSGCSDQHIHVHTASSRLKHLVPGTGRPRPSRHQTLRTSVQRSRTTQCWVWFYGSTMPSLWEAPHASADDRPPARHRRVRVCADPPWCHASEMPPLAAFRRRP